MGRKLIDHDEVFQVRWREIEADETKEMEHNKPKKTIQALPTSQSCISRVEMKNKTREKERRAHYLLDGPTTRSFDRLIDEPVRLLMANPSGLCVRAARSPISMDKLWLLGDRFVGEANQLGPQKAKEKKLVSSSI